ncbi:DUF7662 domain-containing protein [Halopelagius longus]|uniref:GIY-YIG nuclease family protein n=1 Tax=Halopelagius longus TaxID=1236180 RepID=A0A1H0YGA1_9EURY|nr:hypothetical protein [Halopelagius longus]RDI72472.1 GIY-YIG nuclease family protein [Halopelagius longus]SDQ14172.1 hypothetical protein SAMN05216278_0617 [Halopelagius longus]
MEVCGYEFETVSRLDPDRTDDGVVAVQTPQREYEASDERAVHSDGWGPFCRFEVRDPRASRPGVYLVTVDDEAVYVGEAADVADRFSSGYGDVSPADCYEGGAERVCRVNTNVFHAARAGKDVHVHLHSTADFEGTDEENGALRRIIRGDLLSAFDAAWNREDGEAAVEAAVANAAEATADAASAASNRRESGDVTTNGPATDDAATDDATTNRAAGSDAAGTVRRGSPPSGKYGPLYDYLADHELDRVRLSFAELEVVLGAPVPDSARNWRQWWTNSEESHPHARSWLRAGYEVASLSLPDELVVFERLPRGRGSGPTETVGDD